MLKKILSAAVCTAVFSIALSAQNISSGNIFPEIWEGEKSLRTESDCTKAEGDFNNDGIKDIAVIATPKNPEFMRTRDDGYVYNFNKPVLAIFFGQKSGKLKLFSEYKNTIPGDDAENEDCFHETEMSVSSKGVLSISVSEFYSQGGSDAPKTEYVFRYQKGDFYLIGKNYDSFSRYSGDGEKVSENYLTRKKQTVTYNMFDESVPEKETWSKLPSAPLQRLGEKLLAVFEE